MLSRFNSILEPYIEEYEIKLNSSQKSNLYLLEKKLNDGRLGLREAIIELRRSGLKGSKGFFRDSVYRDIKEKLGFNGIKENQKTEEDGDEKKEIKNATPLPEIKQRPKLF